MRGNVGRVGGREGRNEGVKEGGKMRVREEENLYTGIASE